MFAHSTLVFHAVCISAIITIACRPGLPARRPGVLTATVDSALQPSRQLVCNDIPLNTGTGGLKPATGCYFEAKDTLFYFYVAKSGDVLAWGRAWHVPDSTRPDSLRAVALLNTRRYGTGQVCPHPGRVEGFAVWRATGYFVYAYGDPDATKLSLNQNMWEGARTGSPTCTFRDNVSAPLLR